MKKTFATLTQEQKRKRKLANEPLPGPKPSVEGETDRAAGVPLFAKRSTAESGLLQTQVNSNSLTEVDRDYYHVNDSRHRIANETHRLPRPQSSNHSGQIPVAQRQAETNVPVQRDGDGGLPPVPNFQLTPPSLFQPRTPSLLPSSEFQLHLDPEIMAMMRAQAMEQVFQILDPERVRAAMSQLNPAAAPAAVPAIGGATAPGAQPPAASTSTTPSTTPSTPPPTPPLVIPGPRSVSIGGIWALITADPAINQLVTNARSEAFSALGRLSTREKIGLVSATATMVLGPIGILSSDPRYRGAMADEAFNLLNGKVLPIPYTPMSIEFNLQPGSLMMGLHFDLGSVLPAPWGFGSAGFIGPNPMSVPQSPLLPLEREAVPGAMDALPTQSFEQLGQRILAASSGGSSLSDDVRDRLENHLDIDLSNVKLHTDSEADHLARSVDAVAFTTGQNIFLRAGAYNPNSDEGMRLLAHEIVHTQQQASGPVSGTPIPGGVAVSHPSDNFEREADRVAEQVARRSDTEPLHKNYSSRQTPASNIYRATAQIDKLHGLTSDLFTELPRRQAYEQFGALTNPAEVEGGELGQPSAGFRGVAASSPNAPPIVPVQRQPPPDSAATSPAQDASTQGLSPEDARRLIYARTTLNKVPSLDKNDQSTLENSIKDSTAFAVIQERDKKREELQKATEELQNFKYNQQDKSGAPTQDDIEVGNALSKRVEALSDDLAMQDKLVKAVLQPLNVSEEQLVHLVTVDFPDLFVRRGKQIALQQLEENKNLARWESDKYRDVCTEAGDGGPENREGLRMAAQDLQAKSREIDELQLQVREAHKDLPPGGLPEEEDKSSSAADLPRTEDIQTQIEQKQAEYKAKRQGYGAKYPILFRDDIDIAQLANASDDQLTSIVGEKVDEILSNIEITKDNIENDRLKIWKLRDIVELTKQSLGVEKNDTLLSVINKSIEREQQIAADDEKLEKAIKSFALTAALIASLVTANPAIVIGVSAVISAIEVVERAVSYGRISAASDVAVDKAVAQMSAEEPGLIWLILAIASLGFDALMLKQVFNELRVAAQTLEAFSQAARRALPAERAERLIQIAAQELKSGLNVAEQLKAIGSEFGETDRVRIGLLLAEYTEQAYTATFLQLSEEGKILPITEETIRRVAQDEIEAASLIARYINNPNVKVGGFFHPGSRTVFIAGDASLGGVAGNVVHELTHAFQRMTGVAEMVTQQVFYSEFQAHIMQQTFLQKVAADYGAGVIPQESRWMLNATDQEIAEQITLRYRVSPNPDFGLTRANHEDILKQMIEKRLPAIDRRKEFMDTMQKKVEK